MSGTDTARGINFQYACAIDLLLNFPEQPLWQVIQLEGDQDIEDVLVYDQAGQVVVRGQIKQKSDPYQWQPSEFRDVLFAFSQCSDSEDTFYTFTYAGSDGKAVAVGIKPILDKLHHNGAAALDSEEMALLTKKFGADVTTFLLKAGHRISFDKKETWEGLMARGLLRIRELHQTQTRTPLTDQVEQTIYDALFRTLAKAAEGKCRYIRRLSRDDIYAVLRLKHRGAPTTSINIPLYIQAIHTIIDQWSPLVAMSLEREAAVPSILNFVVRAEAESGRPQTGQLGVGSGTEVPLRMAVHQQDQIVVVGEPGCGKTVSLWQLALQTLSELESTSKTDQVTSQIPIYVSLAGYNGASIVQLVRQAIEITGQIVSDEEIIRLAQEGQLLVLFDDFDMAKADQLPDLLRSLRTWCSAYSTSRAVIATHRPSDGHALGLPTFRMRPLDYSQARALLEQMPEVNEHDIVAILNGLPDESRHLVTSPLTVRMLLFAYLYSDRRVPQSQGQLYGKVVEGILALAEQKGTLEFARSDKVRLLALLAQWMQEKEIYSVSLAEFGSLIGQWQASANAAVSHLRSADPLRLRGELLQSGFLRVRIDGNVEFIHPTFRAYFAAKTISTGDLPRLLTRPSWRTSLILWASLTDPTTANALLDLLTNVPLLLGTVIRERGEHRDIIAQKQIEAHQYLDQFVGLFTQLAKSFGVILKTAPWSGLSDDSLQVMISESPSHDFVLVWRTVSRPDSQVMWTDFSTLEKVAADSPFGPPLPVWLLPSAVIRQYHPLELAYLWVLRSLYDVLSFFGLKGGVSQSDMAKHTDHHPAYALITNRFLLYHEFAEGLPEELRSQLRFYATQPFDLAIEVHEYQDPPIVRFAVTESRTENACTIVAGVVRSIDDPDRVFLRAEDGNTYFRVGERQQPVSLIEEVHLGQLMSESPGSVAQSWLRADLQEYVVGFPPRAW